MWKPTREERLGRERARRLYPLAVPCERCGNPKSERHHCDGNPMNNAVENIERLCGRCHAVEDGRATRLRRGHQTVEERAWHSAKMTGRKQPPNVKARISAA